MRSIGSMLYVPLSNFFGLIDGVCTHPLEPATRRERLGGKNRLVRFGSNFHGHPIVCSTSVLEICAMLKFSPDKTRLESHTNRDVSDNRHPSVDSSLKCLSSVLRHDIMSKTFEDIYSDYCTCTSYLYSIPSLGQYCTVHVRILVVRTTETTSGTVVYSTSNQVIPAKIFPTV